jgi:hypothetical protein
MKDVQAIGEAFLKREHTALQNLKCLLFAIFALLDPDPDPHSKCKPESMRIRILNNVENILFVSGLELRELFQIFPR